MGNDSIRILRVLQGVEQAMDPDRPPLHTHGIVRVETPDGSVAVIGPVLDRLVDGGHVTRRPDGTHAGPSKREVHQWVEELAVCDFCAAPHANHILQVPDFDMAVGRSVGGWAACDDCHALYKADRRQDLLKRAIDGLTDGGKFSAAAVQALHRQFWQARDDLADAAGIGAALADYVEDRLPPETGRPTLTDREKRAEAVRRLVGLTPDEQAALERGDVTHGEVVQKLVAWRKKFGKHYEGARLVEELLRAEYRKPVLPGQLPHWERALEARFQIAKRTQQVIQTGTVRFANATDLSDAAAVKDISELARRELIMAQQDLHVLRAAETYSFNAETIGAIRQAAESIPHESPLSSIETPNIGAGWFWFAEPLLIPALSPGAPGNIAALLWAWTNDSETNSAAMRFTCYEVQDDGQLMPTARWHWPLTLSFHEMIAFATSNYRRDFDPDGEVQEETANESEKDTLLVVGEISLFFVMACVWFKQKVVVSAPAHVERHARKRYQREHKLADPPTVQVIALRAALREPGPVEHTGEGGTRNYTCRWIVKGHPRLQAVGPGRAERKLIWIDPHPAGPADKPLRTREKVYAVVR